MIQDILIGCSMLVLTSLLHLLLTYAGSQHVQKGLNMRVPHRLMRVELIVLMTFFCTMVEAAAWAACFTWRGVLASMEEAFYFSLVTYTTLGYGDIVLQPADRLLGALEAANGAIIFGWSTAVIIQALLRLFGKQSNQKESVQEEPAR